MKKILFLFLLFASNQSFSQLDTSKIYELRLYKCHSGKAPNLLRRFRTHTTKLFEKHGMENIAYWVNIEKDTLDLYYIVAHKSIASKDSSWKAFVSDKEWIKVRDDSEKAGKIVKQIYSIPLRVQPEFDQVSYFNAPSPAIFEMRSYTMNPEKFNAAIQRLKNHSMEIFAEVGIKSVFYFQTIESTGKQPKLIYFLAHQSKKAAEISWQNFQNSERWQKIYAETEKDGKLIEKIDQTYLKATDFSKIK
ncbi:MAG: NIPSNAP family protein [Leadbetterella sp.]